MAGDQALFKNTKQDLNQILSIFKDAEYEIKNFCVSHYLDTADMKTMLIRNSIKFTILTLNIQCINAKFDNLLPVINNQSVNGAVFGAICQQDTWLGYHLNLSQFDIPGYEIIHQGLRCTMQTRKPHNLPNM